MIVSTTEVQNNFGKYLKLAGQEDIIITRNGRKVARLVKYENKNEIEIREEIASFSFDGMKVSFEEFKKIAEESESRYEYIDGRIYQLASPSVNHQRVIRRIFGRFIFWFDNRECEPFTSPFNVTLYQGEKGENNINIVQPDILVICDQEKINDEDRYMGTPELIIEVLSKSNKNHDLIRKLELYRTTGIKEYWIVNPFSREINLFTFQQGDIDEIRTYKNKEVLKSVIFAGLQLNLGDIF